MEQIRTFKGGLNTDDSVEILSADDYQYAANVVSGRSYLSQNGNQELLMGTSALGITVDLYEELFGSSLGDWSNVGSGETWAWNASGSGAALVQLITAGGTTNSKYLTRDYNTYTGIEYSIDLIASLIDFVDGTANGSIKIYFSDGASRDLAFSLSFDENDSSVSDTQTFTALNDYDKIEIYVELTSSSNPTEVNVYIGSHSLTRVLPLDSNSTCIGVIRSVKDDIHYLFFHNTDADKNCILKLDNDVLSNVITWSGLNFSTDKNKRINGGGIAGDLLYFTDNYNEPRCVHTTRYLNSPPDEEEEVLVIKRGPQLCATFEKYLLGPDGAEYTISSAGASTVVTTVPIEVGTPATGGLRINGNEYTYTSWTGSTFSGVSPTPAAETGTLNVCDELEQSLINDFSFQFSYYYEYTDRQLSVLAPYSILCSKSTESEDYRRIGITIPSDELIPELVDEIVVCARVNNSGSFFEIGRLTKTAGVFTVLDFDFYNNTNGNVVDPFLTQPFSLVPRLAGSMAISKSRLWLANILEGYDTPEDIDMNFSVESQSATGTSFYQVYRLRRRQYEKELGMPWTLTDDEYIFFDTTYEYIIVRGDVFDVVEFDPITWDGTTTINLHAGFTDIPKTDYPDVDTSALRVRYTYEAYTDATYPSGVSIPVEITPSISIYVGQKTFPSSSSYKLGIVFSDHAGRKSGVYTNDNLLVSTPRERYDKISINWTLGSSDNIPTWARYYSIVRTKNLKKSQFIENYALDIKYQRTKVDDSEETYIGTDSAARKNYPYLKVDVRNLALNNLGYSFVAGDRVILRSIGTTAETHDVLISSFDGQYLLCEKGDVDVVFVANTYADIEIYRPITTGGADLVFYEVGHIYPLEINVVSELPEFTVVSGILDGDASITIRDIYEIAIEIEDGGDDASFKTMAVDDDGLWNTSIGRPFIQTSVGEVQKSAYFRHSSTYIAGTEINGLSDFDSGDEGNIPVESGTVQKLQPTHKESTEGDVLLAIADSDSFSVYIDESRITAGTSSFLVGATRVIGDVRKQRSGFGSLHPESVHEEDGYVYFFDRLSRSYCRYASNGIFPISEYKVVTHFERQAALNDSDDIVVSGYDPFYKIVFVSFTNADTTVKKTIAYSITKERWIGYFDFAPEAYVIGSANLYSVKDGVVYKHSDTTNFNRFYGVDYNGVIDCSFNDSPDSPKEWRAVALGVSPSFYQFASGDQSVITNGLKVDISNMHGQATDIRHDEFEVDENMVYGEIMGDTNTGTLLTGDQIYSNTMQSRITMIYGTYKYLIYAKAGFEISQGHQL